MFGCTSRQLSLFGHVCNHCASPTSSSILAECTITYGFLNKTLRVGFHFLLHLWRQEELEELRLVRSFHDCQIPRITRLLLIHGIFQAWYWIVIHHCFLWERCLLFLSKIEGKKLLKNRLFSKSTCLRYLVATSWRMKILERTYTAKWWEEKGTNIRFRCCRLGSFNILWENDGDSLIFNILIFSIMNKSLMVSLWILIKKKEVDFSLWVYRICATWIFHLF